MTDYTDGLGKAVRVEAMTSPISGRAVPNQLILHRFGGSMVFQSYDTIIACIYPATLGSPRVVRLAEGYWDFYSATTNKYLNRFLGTSGVAEIRKKVASGEFEVVKGSDFQLGGAFYGL